MRINLIEVSGDYVRSDQIAAVDIDTDNNLRVHLIGTEEAITWAFDDLESARRMQTRVVKAWLDDITSILK